MRHRPHRSALLTALSSAALLACGGAGDSAQRDSAVTDTLAAAGDSAAASWQTAPARRMASTPGFETPESVKWDAGQSVWFVSNINGNPSNKDGNGFISRLRADGSLDSLRFIAGGRGGVTLNAPKGMALVGDTLWVADIDAVRAFDARTGAPIASVELAGQRATFLNDVAVGADGSLYVTDTGIRFGPTGEMSKPGRDQIFRIAAGARTATVAAASAGFSAPNGIAFDAANNRFLVAPFGGTSVFAWNGTDTTLTSLGTGPGEFDGIEVLADGRILASSWADSSIHVFARSGGASTRLVTGVASPADFGIDPARNMIAVPLFTGNRVELWAIR
jgi:sugar lactone lactonase YvrE